MMNSITHVTLQPLLEISADTKVSIYMPTHRTPTSPHINEDRIRYKNLVRQARDALQKKNIEESEIQAITKQLEAKLEDDEFWQRTSRGLGIFADKTKCDFFILPVECDEHLTVEKNFDITPLLVLHSYDKPYHLLVLAVHNPKLYRGDMYGLKPVDISFPSSPEDALNIDEMFSNSQTQRGGATLGGGDVRMGTHGQGDSREAGNEERLKYFRIIDEKIASAKEVNSSYPLLIAGVQSEVTEYKNNSKYTTIMEAYISGNHTETELQDLHALAWPAVQNELGGKEQEKMMRKVQEARGAGKSSEDITAIREATKTGRIGTLLLGILTITHDTISDTNNEVTKVIFPAEYEKEQINSCATEVFKQGGKVIGVQQEATPRDMSVAAIYRY